MTRERDLKIEEKDVTREREDPDQESEIEEEEDATREREDPDQESEIEEEEDVTREREDPDQENDIEEEDVADLEVLSKEIEEGNITDDPREGSSIKEESE